MRRGGPRHRRRVAADGPRALSAFRPPVPSAIVRPMTYREPPQPHPLIAVYFGTATALDRASGRVLWKYVARTVIGRFALANDRVFLLDDICQLHCLDAATGAVVGVVQIDQRERSACALVPDGGVLYVATTHSVIAVNSEGQVLWRTEDVGTTRGLRAGLGLPGSTAQPDYGAD
jgi:PQQ-like domain